MDGMKEIYAVIQKRVEKYPFAEENDECMPGFDRIYTESTEIEYDPNQDLRVESWEGLIRDFYARKNLPLPFPLKRLDELIGSEQQTTEGEPVLIDSADSYLYWYGLEPANLYWVREVDICAALCLTKTDADLFVEQNQTKLRTPQVKPIPLNSMLDESLSF